MENTVTGDESMFEIVCMNCESTVIAMNEKKLQGDIEIGGEVRVIFDADVYLGCKHCGNEVRIIK